MCRILTYMQPTLPPLLPPKQQPVHTHTHTHSAGSIRHQRLGGRADPAAGHPRGFASGPERHDMSPTSFGAPFASRRRRRSGHPGRWGESSDSSASVRLCASWGRCGHPRPGGGGEVGGGFPEGFRGLCVCVRVSNETVRRDTAHPLLLVFANTHGLWGSVCYMRDKRVGGALVEGT